MGVATVYDDQNHAWRQRPCATVPAQAIVLLVAGMAAAWFAAGSTGLLGHPLRHALTWSALVVAIVAAWPPSIRLFRTWATLAGGVIFGLLLTALALPTVNVLAVAIVLAAVAQVSRGLTGRLALIVALGATVLGCFRFAYVSIPMVWLAADGAGWALGRLAGWLAGYRLEVGATFGGIDFLVLTATIYAAWLVCTAPPRGRRALWAAVAIVVGHVAYLTVLAYSEKLLAILPEVVLPPASDHESNVGIWTWSNALRTLIPWNVPLLAMMIDGAIVALMVGRAPWLPVIELDPAKLKRQQEKEEKEEIPGSVLAADMLFRFGPALLAVAAVLLAALVVNKSADLRGKTIVAYEKGYLNWLKPEYDSDDDGLYGMLPVFVESLGGKFVKSKDLSEQDLAVADVLLLVHPDQPWPGETLERVWDYVRGGGSLLLVAEPAIHEGDSSSSFNDVLRPLAMRVCFDTTVARSGNWEQSYDALAHPATVGIDDLRNRFAAQLGSSIRVAWPARPVLAGRWGWSDPGSDAAASGISHYNAGERLGDLVLAVEQPLGRGRVFVLGDTSALHNEAIANSYPFVGRLLAYLAHRPSSPQAPWRQLSALAALAAMVGLLAGRPAAWQLMLTPAVMAVSLACCTSAGYWSGRVLPDGRAAGAPNNVAYIDASHLEAYSSDPLTGRGVAGLSRALMRHGYLPLLAADLTPERLERSGLLISIGPARKFSPAERHTVKNFVGAGGTFLCLVGAEEARASAPLLADFGFQVPHSPVPPDEDVREPEPIGGGVYGRTVDGNLQTPFYAAWPVESTDAGNQQIVFWLRGANESTLVSGHSEGGGTFVVIGDTHFASNENIQFDESASIRFWRWLLSRVVAGQKAWDPPVEKDAEKDNGETEKDGQANAEEK